MKQYAYKSTKNFLHRSERILEILIYIKLVAILYKWFIYEKKNRNMWYYYVNFEIRFCLSYEKVNYCKIQSSII